MDHDAMGRDPRFQDLLARDSRAVLRDPDAAQLKGVIWYQGEANTRTAWLYAQLFPAMIPQWRSAWNQGVFPFYWVQLPGYQPNSVTPEDSEWAELRESQSMTMELPHTGQAVTLDLGDANDLHPKNKLEVANRLARWPLVHDYGLSMPFHSPDFKDGAILGKKMKVTFDYTGSGLCTKPGTGVKGFAICGADRQWFWAKAEIMDGNSVMIWSDKVKAPVAVRYEWSDNPVCTLFTKDGLPVNPFRTDGFDLITQPKNSTSKPSP